MITKNNIITGILLIAAIISVTAHLHQDAEIRRLEKERFQQKTDDLQQQLEQTTRTLERLEIARNADYRLADSLLAVVRDNHSKLKEKDREIANLKGKYNHISVDSLETLMEKRAWKKGN